MIHDTIILKNHDIKKSASPLLSKGSIQKNQILKRRYFVKSNYVAEHQEHLLSAHHSADPDDNDAAHGQLFDRSKCNVTTMNATFLEKGEYKWLSGAISNIDGCIYTKN